MTSSIEQLDSGGLRKVLIDVLSDGKRIQIIPNPGNGGDALINAGMWRVLSELRVNVEVSRKIGDGRNTIYIYPGGGNLIPQYSAARSAIEALLERPFKRFILLPHSVRGNEDLLARMDERFHLFARELVAFDHVRRHAPAARVYLAQDLALELTTDWILDPWRFRWNLAGLVFQPRLLRRYLRWRAKLSAFKPVNDRLIILRVDTEAAAEDDRNPALDLSACYGAWYLSRREAELITRDFLAVLQGAGTIVTDRLHVGIGACLVGRKVIILDNSYGKNRAIFDFSLRDRFPLARFMQGEEVTTS